MMLKNVLYALVVFGFLAGFGDDGEAATWCHESYVRDVICYSNGECYITVGEYGGNRFYRINKDDPNKNQMVSVAVSALLSGKQTRLAFARDSLDCNDIVQNELIFGVGIMK